MKPEMLWAPHDFPVYARERPFSLSDLKQTNKQSIIPPKMILHSPHLAAVVLLFLAFAAAAEDDSCNHTVQLVIYFWNVNDSILIMDSILFCGTWIAFSFWIPSGQGQELGWWQGRWHVQCHVCNIWLLFASETRPNCHRSCPFS